MNHHCPRRPSFDTTQTQDTYRVGHGLVGQSRGCSYCGSMHPQDFMEAVRSGIEIGPTDKGYKLYVNGGSGGKFYTSHLSPAQGWEFHELWSDKRINWGYPGYPYARLFIPGPSNADPSDHRLRRPPSEERD